VLALDALAGVLLLVLLLVVPLGAVTVRRRLLQRQGGTIELSLRLHTRSGGRGWVLGVGRFEGDDLRWYRVFSLAPGPRRTLSRHDLEVVARRQPVGGETLALLSGVVVLECTSASGPVQIAMDPVAVTGFLAWLEARPPGATLPPGQYG
jgi:hypothetical protein